MLDIYGFENFEGINGFEQLLINFANEKLQNHFNKHIFLIEQKEYAAEGIDWSYISFNDNANCVELIEGRPNGKAGILQTLDDSIASGGRSDPNNAFLSQISQSFSGVHPNYVTPRFNVNLRFGINHYAGEVFYEIFEFSEKNRDSMNIDMKQVLASSSNELLKKIAEDVIVSDIASSIASTPGAGAALGRKNSKSVQPKGSFVSKLKEDSISKQFTNSLKNLYDTLDACEPHFVRCIKPNKHKMPDRLDALMTVVQLRNAGMMETIRIRKQGYALRELHDDFFKRYAPMLPTCRTLQ